MRSRGALTPSALAQLRHVFGVIVIMYKVGTSSRSWQPDRLAMYSSIRLGSPAWAAQSN